MARKKKVDFHTLLFICRLAKNLRPQKELTVCQWAEENMILPEGSNAAGKFPFIGEPIKL